MRPSNLKGRIALITGSTSGIGLAIAQRLMEDGAAICLHGLADTAQIDAAISLTSSPDGVRSRHFGGDLTEPGAAERLIDDVERFIGPVDILVNSAGIQHVSPIMEFSLDRWNAVLGVNLTAAFLTIQRALPKMLARNWGRIINIASISGYIGVPNKAAYAASKHGLLGLTKVVASETARTGVTCNAICPGWVLTPLVERQIDARARQEGADPESIKAVFLSSVPSGQFVSPEQVAGLASFLCSPDASEVRGVGWSMDGGRLAR
ncbi:3-hydroxybutyrate dehydrogenase [Bradyrhizobium sp. CCGB12]|uniref:3-hydroxybutyrate dehydrogenase n=1 Tax=Bradyrhizobium sp. CCGB12 TaxID=2949632 RepID=UPI0020B33D9D|nr:3-hydroxybutyrate dehydrogenase [Bradyrhizobium sp. CCGB12]MCP3392288.1 3-hydroxybutyrate dehydrogenase [Bradyrhizobium sp. CCGB12]